MASSTTEAKRNEIRRWHVDNNGWSDIGYHYLIDRNGQVIEGRPVSRSGAHVRGRNKQSIGIALMGGHGGSETDKFADHFTPAQDAALRSLIGELKGRYGDMEVNGHNQYAAKACPCFHAPTWFEGKGISRKYISPTAEAAIADAGKPLRVSKTAWASILGIGGTAWQAWQSADPMVQAAALIVGGLLVFVFFDRFRKSRLGKAALSELGL